jgi:hypothetical protein
MYEALIAIVLLGLLFIVLPVILDAHHRLLQQRIITCPERHCRAQISVDPGPPVFGAVVSKPVRRVMGCSLWTRSMECEGKCLKEDRRTL